MCAKDAICTSIFQFTPDANFPQSFIIIIPIAVVFGSRSLHDGPPTPAAPAAGRKRPAPKDNKDSGRAAAPGDVKHVPTFFSDVVSVCFFFGAIAIY